VARSKALALECLQKRVLNIIFPGSEYITNLIIANMETLSHDDSYILTAFLQTAISLGEPGAMTPCPLWIRHSRYVYVCFHTHYQPVSAAGITTTRLACMPGWMGITGSRPHRQRLQNQQRSNQR